MLSVERAQRHEKLKAFKINRGGLRSRKATGQSIKHHEIANSK
jgi:hypothetical protein